MVMSLPRKGSLTFVLYLVIASIGKASLRTHGYAHPLMYRNYSRGKSGHFHPRNDVRSNAQFTREYR